jgi:hypothetical protein
MVFGVGNDVTSAVNRAMGSNQTMVHQFLATSAADTYWVQRITNAVPLSGTVVTINDTAPTGDRYNLSLCEILPAASSLPDTTPPSISISSPAVGATVSGTTVTVSAMATDNTTVAGVQFRVDGVNLGSEDLAAPYSISWNTTSSGNGTHSLTAAARDAAGNAAISAAVSVTVNNSSGSADLTVDGNQPFQTFDGFMVNANSAAWNNGELKSAIDLLVDQGVAIFRVIIDKTDWEAVNDNADPKVFNWGYYNTVYTSPKFENFWNTIAYLNQKGITNGVLLSFMGPTPAWMGSPRLNSGYEEEYAEMIASLVYYARVTRNLQFTHVGASNEVDWNGIEGPQIDQWQYATVLHKLAERLDTIGLGDIRLVGPDTADISSGVNSYMPELLADSTVMPKIAHFGLHNYAELAGGAANAIRNSAYPNRNFWMTEAGFGNDYYGPHHLLVQVKNGAASAGVWDAYYSVYNHMPNDAYPMLAHTGSGVWTPNLSFYAYKLFKFVQPGSTRIAVTELSNVTAVAFYNQASGKVTLVGHNSGSSRTLRILFTNVPVSSLQYYQTSISRNFQRQADPAISNGAVTINVDQDGYFTLTTPGTIQSDLTPPSVAVLSPADGSFLSGTVTVSASASDNIGVVGVQFKLDGANIGTEDTASPYSISWNSTMAQNGTHTITAVARDAAGNSATSAAVSIIVSNTVSSGLSMDAVASGDQPLAKNTVATSTFSTTAGNELLLAFVSADDSSPGNTVTGISGAGLTWQLVLRTNVQRGTAEIWRAFSAAALANVTVTATLGQTVASSITVVSFKGANTSGTNGSAAIGATASANASGGAPTASLTTTRANSWVFGVGVDWDNPIARTLGTNQVLIHQYLPPVGDTYWVQRMASPTPASGTKVAISDTAPTGDRYNLSICEILPQ